MKSVVQKLQMLTEQVLLLSCVYSTTTAEK